jgi:hypothetical protein
MKEQSGWAWNSITRLPNVSVGVMNDYVEVSFELFLNISTRLIFSQAHPKSKIYFMKAFPMYDDIADLLGDARATGFASNDGRNKQAASQAIPRSSKAPASTAASFAIDPVLEEISLEMLSNRGVDSEEVVH